MAMLQDKLAVVTGAARGIGAAIARRLAADGANLALCDLDAGWLDESAAAVRAAGRGAAVYGVDVSDAAAVDGVVAAIVKEHGRIDILVNNAGITRDALLVRMRDDDWDAVLNVNLKGTFLFTRAAARPMMKQRAGAIVNIASIIGLIGNAGQCNYAASKAGVVALTKSAARELAARNIRVNAVAPGFIESKMTDVLSEDVRARMLEAIPMRRFGKPDDVAKVVAFLVGDESSYMTGQVLTISGGMVM